MILDSASARLEFAALCPPSVCPELDENTEVITILLHHQRATLWTASRVYNIGDRIVPTLANRNGHRYKAVAYTDISTDQLSDTTEPSWPTWAGARTTDNHVIWEEEGHDWNCDLWDIIAAAREGWLLKASKASTTSDMVIGEMQMKSSQLYDHCLKQADEFQPVFVL